MNTGKRMLSILLSVLTVLTCTACLTLTSSASYKLGDTFTFGSYPQTRVTNSVTISALNAKATSWTSMGLYSGAGSWNTAHPSNYTQYCDVSYGGAKYRGVKFTAYRPADTTYAMESSSGNPGPLYPQYENGYRINTTYWFRYEPLKWRVLDPNTGLILCLSVIDAQPISNEVDYHDGKYYNKNNSTQYYACDYTHSSLRTWLNETFYTTAFSSDEQGKIIPATVHNKGLSTLQGKTTHPELDFANTTEKVFLPAYDEMIDTSKGYEQYPGNADTLRARKGTDYAKCLGLGVYNDGNSYWRMRTAGNDTLDNCVVNFNGQSAWAIQNAPHLTKYGVVPTLCCSDVKTSAPKNVTVTFNPNGGSVSTTSKTVTVGGTYGTLPTPTRTGHTFDGWYDGSTKITATSTVTRTEAHTLIAHWTSSGTTVTVTFDAAGGTVLQPSKTVTVGQAYGTLPTPSRWGYTFLGWYDGSTKITETSTVTRTTAHTLTAHWEGALVTVIFDANGGAVSPTTKTVRVGDPYGELPLPKRSNYTFLGWYTISDALVSTTTIVSTIIPHTLVAHWVETSLLPTVGIENYVETRKVDYRTTITFNALVDKAPIGAEVHWIINGEDVAVGNSYTAKEVTKDFTVQAKLMLGNVPIAGSMTETVTVKTGFFARLVAFFRGIFHRLPVITQEYLGLEIKE